MVKPPGAWLSFALAFLCGIYLVWHGGWPIVAIGLALAACRLVLYWRAARLAYGPLWAKAFVCHLFRPGRCRRQLLPANVEHDADALFAAGAGRHPCAAVITVNNYRDHDGDEAERSEHAGCPPGRRPQQNSYGGGAGPHAFATPARRTRLAGQFCPAFVLLLALQADPHRFHNETPRSGFNTILAATAGLVTDFALLLHASFTI